MDTENPRQYLSLREFQKATGLSESTIRRRVKDGSLLVHQPGGKRKKLLFPRDALVTSQTDGPPAENHREPRRTFGPRPHWMPAATGKPRSQQPKKKPR
ncbi:MAG: helix-turn-helix transcriptional regulator [Pirellulales bacterium]